MVNLELSIYIKNSLASGLSSEEIRRNLLKAGWREKDIEDAFQEISLGGQEISSDLIGEIKALRKTLEEQSQKLRVLESKVLGEPSAPVYVYPAPKEKLKEAMPVEKSAVSPQETIEAKVTGKWFGVIGIVAIIFGVSFFLKYAFENNLIGVTGRVIMGVMAGLIFLILGDWLSSKEKYRQYSFFISGGGLALLYLSVYGAFAFYNLISQTTAFIFLAFITLGGSLISLRSDSQNLATLAIFGGFLTPVLVSTGTDNQFALFGYITILNFGILILSYFKKWRQLYFLSFIGTYAIFYSWYFQFYAPEKLFTTLSFLTLFFLIFLIAPFLLSIFRNEKSDAKDILVSSLNAALYSLTSYNLLQADYQNILGFFFVFWAAIYMFVAYIVYAMNREDDYGMSALAGAGLVLLTIAVPVQLNKNWITIAWAVEGLILTWFGFRLKTYYLRIFANLVFLITVVRLIFIDTSPSESLSEFIVIFNIYFFTFVISIVSLFVAAYLYKIYSTDIEENEKVVPTVLGVSANLLAIGILSLEFHTFFEQRIVELSQAKPLLNVFQQYPTISKETSSQIRALQNIQNLSLSIIWAVYSSILMVIGILKRIRAARILALVIFAVTIFKVFLFDIAQLSELYRILSFIILGIILLTVSFLFYRFKEKIKEFLLVQ